MSAGYDIWMLRQGLSKKCNVFSDGPFLILHRVDWKLRHFSVILCVKSLLAPDVKSGQVLRFLSFGTAPPAYSWCGDDFYKCYLKRNQFEVIWILCHAKDRGANSSVFSLLLNRWQSLKLDQRFCRSSQESRLNEHLFLGHLHERKTQTRAIWI